jgi:hypothetical protein
MSGLSRENFKKVSYRVGYIPDTIEKNEAGIYDFILDDEDRFEIALGVSTLMEACVHIM